MRRVIGSVEIRQVTGDACRAAQRIVIVHVAGRALLRRVHPHQSEASRRMVEDRAQPVCRRVAARAILREIGRFVRRIGGPVIVRLVAVPACRAAQTVIVINVALRALQCGMCAGQREPSGRMVEGGAGPVGDRGPVTDRAIRWETRRLVRRVDCAVEFFQMAVDASGTAERVVVVHVAGGALLRRVHTYKREAGRGVVKSRTQPVHGRMAARAVLREIRRFVRRIISAVIIRLVAVPARPIGNTVIVVHVALRALQRRMRAGQSKAGCRVIKGRAGPVDDGVTVTQGAILRETGGCVRRIQGSHEIGLVAVPAGAAAQGVIIGPVTRRALLGGMHAHEREAGRRVVELGPQPLHGIVTTGAILREICRLMVWISGRIEIIQVASNAGAGRQRKVVVDMALRTLQAGMGAG